MGTYSMIGTQVGGRGMAGGTPEAAALKGRDLHVILGSRMLGMLLAALGEEEKDEPAEVR